MAKRGHEPSEMAQTQPDKKSRIRDETDVITPASIATAEDGESEHQESPPFDTVLDWLLRLRPDSDQKPGNECENPCRDVAEAMENYIPREGEAEWWLEMLRTVTNLRYSVFNNGDFGIDNGQRHLPFLKVWGSREFCRPTKQPIDDGVDGNNLAELADILEGLAEREKNGEGANYCICGVEREALDDPSVIAELVEIARRDRPDDEDRDDEEWQRDAENWAREVAGEHAMDINAFVKLQEECVCTQSVHSYEKDPRVEMVERAVNEAGISAALIVTKAAAGSEMGATDRMREAWPTVLRVFRSRRRRSAASRLNEQGRY
jgi:hypothetical protein